MKINKYLLLTVLGVVLTLVPTVLSLQIVGEIVQITTSSPVYNGEVCTIDVAVNAGVGVSGSISMFVDDNFLNSLAGSGGSDGYMYFSTGWTAVGYGDHELRVVYFEQGDPNAVDVAYATITVLEDDEPVLPDVGMLPFQIVGLGTACFGGYNYFIKRKRD